MNFYFIFHVIEQNLTTKNSEELRACIEKAYAYVVVLNLIQCVNKSII